MNRPLSSRWSTRIPRALTTMLVLTLPMTIAGCGNHAVQTPVSGNTAITPSHKDDTGKNVTGNTVHTSSSVQQPQQTASSKANSSSTSPTSSPPDATGLFQDIKHAASTTTSTSVQDVQAIGKSHLEQSVQQTSMKPSESDLVKPYVAQMESLQSEYASSLYALYEKAKTAYHSGQKTKLQIENEYIPQVIQLEDGAQSRVNTVLFSLRDALVSNGYPTDEVNVLRNAYYSAVAQMQSTLGKG